jgi:hypothetical protein
MTDLVLHITNEQRQQIEEIARERGYSAPDDYLLALVAADEKNRLLADLRQSIHEAMTGDTVPASKLLEALEDED